MRPIPAIYLAACYLIGAIPFGYLIARGKGVDLFQAGSGNIGATNVGRVLGRKFGILVFVLDFAKGALPVAGTGLIAAADRELFGFESAFRVSAGLLSFLGHLFPIYLGFRGGKGVATGAGVISVLVPGPALVAILVWGATVAAGRMVSLASIAAVLALSISCIVSRPQPFSGDDLPITLFCLLGTGIVIIKHQANLIRILKGTENRLPESPKWDTMNKTIHLTSLGLWFGSAIFFNFIAAPAMNDSFKAAIQTAPNDRTAHIDIVKGLDDEKKKSLGSALFGTAVGPLFPRFFVLQAICVGLALITAMRWWREPESVHRTRVYFLALAVVLIAVSWPISEHVSELRVERFAPDFATANAAKESFASWHLLSLLLSAFTAFLAIATMILAAKLPANDKK